MMNDEGIVCYLVSVCYFQRGVKDCDIQLLTQNGTDNTRKGEIVRKLYYDYRLKLKVP
jgi:hypothetical protein